MSRRLTNGLLLATVLTLLGTGLIAWAIPESQATPLYALHRIAGVGLVLALPWKQVVAHASLARRIRLGVAPSAVPGIAATVALALTVGLGLAWTFGLVSFDRPIPYSAMNLHVFAGVALVPLVVWHLVRRWEPPRASDITSRRAALRLLALGVAAAVAGTILERFPTGRRITGSKHAGSFTGNDFPLTIWAFDQVPAIDPRTHRIEVTGLADGAPLDMAAITSAPRMETNAIIDCTGGWWSEQRWAGASLFELLRSRGLDPAAQTVTVRSVTGHAWSFAVDEVREALLATHVGDEELAPGHGYPVRLVVPGRQGFSGSSGWGGSRSAERGLAAGPLRAVAPRARLRRPWSVRAEVRTHFGDPLGRLRRRAYACVERIPVELLDRIATFLSEASEDVTDHRGVMIAGRS